jgi:hypothetical protein
MTICPLGDLKSGNNFLVQHDLRQPQHKSRAIACLFDESSVEFSPSVLAPPFRPSTNVDTSNLSSFL